MSDKLSQLKELKELFDSGTLTQEEFNDEKKKILAGSAYSSPPIAGTIVQPVQAVMPGGSIPASWLDGCWLCCCFPLGPGFYCSKATGADTKMDTVFWLFLPIVPLPDARERIPGTNNFRGGDPSSVDYYSSSRCLAAASPFPSCGFRIC